MMGVMSSLLRTPYCMASCRADAVGTYAMIPLLFLLPIFIVLSMQLRTTFCTEALCKSYFGSEKGALVDPWID